MNNYLNQVKSNQYLIDKLGISFYTFLPNNILNNHFKEDFKRSRNIKISDMKNGIRIERRKNGYALHYLLHKNYNSIIRNKLKEMLDISYIKSDFYTSDNVIPSHLRFIANEKNIPLEYLRNLAHDCIWENIKEVKHDIKEFIKPYLINTNIIKFKTSLSYIEINFDILTSLSVYLATNQAVQENFKKIVRSFEISSFENNSQEIPATHFKNKTATILGIEGNRIYLRGFLPDKTKIKIYTKEESKYGVINRIERVITKRKQILPMTGYNSFSSKSEYLILVDKIGYSTSKICKEILKTNNKLSKKAYKLFIKECCKRYYGRHFEEAYYSLTTNNHYIITSGELSSHKSIVRVTRRLFADKKLVKRTSKATYRLNSKWIKEAIKNPQLLN